MPSKSRGKAPAKSKKQAPKTQTTNQTPQWPPLRPLVPTADLCLETVLEDQIVVIRNLFTSTLCKSYVSFMSSLPLITTPAQSKEGDAVRVNDRIQFDDPGFAENLWKNTALESLVKDTLEKETDDKNVSSKLSRGCWDGDVIGLNPKIRVYRYKEGQFFAQHCRLTYSHITHVCPLFHTDLDGAPFFGLSLHAAFEFFSRINVTIL